MEDTSNVDLISCACNCGELIPKFDIRGRPRRFKQGHWARLHGFFKGMPGLRKGSKPSDVTRKKMSDARKGRFVAENSNSWKGGKCIKKGYRYVYSPNHPFVTKDGYVFEHRLVWEEHNKAILLPWGDIHHKDGNKLNNKIENLDAMIHGKHTTLTNTKDFSKVRCCYCGNSTHIKKNGKPMWYRDKNDREKFVCKRCYDGIQKGYFKPLGF